MRTTSVLALAAVAVSAVAAAPLQSRGIFSESTITLFPTFGTRGSAANSWNFVFRGSVTELLPVLNVENNVIFKQALKLVKDDAERARLYERVGEFTRLGEFNKEVEVSFPGVTATPASVTLSKTDVAGFFNSSATVVIPGASGSTSSQIRTDLSAWFGLDKANGTGTIELFDDGGFGIVTDIDDTIKVSNVLGSTTDLLRNTFLEEFKAVPGTPDAYKRLVAATTTNGVRPSFHYVSGSPWNLLSFLQPFTVAAGFPAGSWHLRNLALLDGSIFEFLGSPREFKTAAISQEIVSKFRTKRFILIGDSTQSDPEVYGDIYRAFPGRVARIFIRVVSGVNAEEEATLNAPSRFATAFQGIPTSVWTTFTDPAAIRL